jgi:hypothetical protein
MKTKEQLISEFKEKTFKVSIDCSHCGERINGIIIDGDFEWHGMAEWASGSELFDDFLADFNRILCGSCCTEKVSKKWEDL